MGREPGWGSKATGRPPMRSPGPAKRWTREHKQRFWIEIAAGASSEDAAVTVGMAPAVGSRWVREAGGMPDVEFNEPTGRHLRFAEREEIALLRAKGMSVRAIARELGRAPSTISRELRRNASTRGGTLTYRATVAQWHCDRRAARPKQAKLASNERLADYVQERLAGRISRPDGSSVPGPDISPWQGRRRVRRQDRRWARCWSPEQICQQVADRLPG
jgi:transposase-like protein